jgi:hypothetical protein
MADEPISTAPHDRQIEVWNGFTGWYVSQFEGGEWPLRGPQQDGRFWEGGVWYPVPSLWREIEAPGIPS